MNYSSPPLSPSSSTQHTTSTHSTPTLPHSIIAAAHCLAPLDDLHLAHLINELKPNTPSWSFNENLPNSAHPTPIITSNDRLRSDELADLPAPEAERLHATYDIEDYLDATPDRLLVFGPSTPIIEILNQVKELLIKKSNINSTSYPQPGLHHPHDNQIVYVARVLFQPNDGPESSYTWEKGGPDLIRFELDSKQSLLPHHHLPIIINWSPVELALSQALEIGHQLLALLHSRQFSEILSTLELFNTFRPINPIVWLVDPVEYAHAQLRETTEWGWSEYHVELSSLNDHQSTIPSTPTDHPNASSSVYNSTHASRDYAPCRPISKSHLSHELYSIDENQQRSADSNQHFDPNDSNSPISSPPSSQKYHHLKCLKNLAEDLPNWLNDLLDRRLPRLLSLPDGCLSYELLNPTYSSNSSNRHIPCKVASKSIPSIKTSPPEKSHLISPDGQSSSIKLVPHIKWSTLSALATPTRAVIPEQRSVANSVASFDQHHLLSPSVTNSLRHVQTNTLKYYPCKACSEHAFKLALSHQLNEEKRRLRTGAGSNHNNNKFNLLNFHAHTNTRRGSKNINQTAPGGHERSSSGELVLDGDLASGSSTFGVSSSRGSVQIDSSSKLSPPSSSNVKSNTIHHHKHLDHQLLQSHQSSTTYPVIGLGLKGKAIKEAMDREHDEFINHQKSLCSILGFNSYRHDDSNSCSKHAWDEGEVVED